MVLMVSELDFQAPCLLLLINMHIFSVYFTPGPVYAQYLPEMHVMHPLLTAFLIVSVLSPYSSVSLSTGHILLVGCYIFHK